MLVTATFPLGASGQVRLEARQGTTWGTALELPQMQPITFRWLWAGTKAPARADREIFYPRSVAPTPPASVDLGAGYPYRKQLQPIPGYRQHATFSVTAADLASPAAVFYVRVRVEWAGGGVAASSWVKVATGQAPPVASGPVSTPTAPAPAPTQPGGVSGQPSNPTSPAPSPTSPAPAPTQPVSPTRAPASGLIGGVSVDPSSVATGVSSTITVLGLGTCGQLSVDFGDGTSTTLSSVALAGPAKIKHTYYKTGHLNVVVRPISNCKGYGGKTAFTYPVEVVSVLAVVDNLCAIMGCDQEPQRASAGTGTSGTSGVTALGAICEKPVITAIDRPVVIQPKSEVIIRGCGFGTTPHQVRLKAGFPGGHLALQVLEWLPNAIHAKVPSVTGVRDQPSALLQVVRQDLAVSNAPPVKFQATREVRTLPGSAVVRLCSDATNHNDCGGGSGVSYQGVHTSWYPNLDPTTGNRDSGTDAYLVVLLNGWKLHTHQFSRDVVPPGGEVTLLNGFLGGFNVGTPHGVLGVNWTTPVVGEVSYWGKVYVRGPVGVPFN